MAKNILRSGLYMATRGAHKVIHGGNIRDSVNRAHAATMLLIASTQINWAYKHQSLTPATAARWSELVQKMMDEVINAY